MRDNLIEIAERLRLAASAPDSPRRIEEIAADLRTLAARAQGVPEGWQLVPRVLTPEMKRAIRRQRSGAKIGKGDQANWDALLLAAPAPDPVPVAVPTGWRVMRATSRVLGDDWELHDPHGNGAAFRGDEVPPIVGQLLEALATARAPDAAQAKGEAVKTGEAACADCGWRGKWPNSDAGRRGACPDCADGALFETASPAQHAPTGAQVVTSIKYTRAMGEAAERYHASFRTGQPLPQGWRWQRLWDAMIAAATQENSHD